jgi:predicted nucleic acid-binding protein
MIVVDTSVWVAALRSARCPEAGVLGALIDADEVLLPIPVRIELLSGASGPAKGQLRRGLSALPVAYPTDETWRLLETWVDLAAAKGQRFGVGDLLIGALARESGALVWSLDRDVARLGRLKLIDLYEP